MTVRRLPALLHDPWTSPTPLSDHPLRHWLIDRGSLTARIAARCKTVKVDLLTQRLGAPHRDEAQFLGLRRGELAWMREVVLVADGVPVVYARSVLSRQSLRGAWGMFAGIGSRPLGAALFADPRIRRGLLTTHKLDRRDRRYHRAVLAAKSKQANALWARRSCFVRKGRSLMVCEVFLKEIENLTL